MNISVKQRLSNFLAPTFHGITFSQWLKILRNRNLKFDFPYHYRIIPTTLKSTTNSMLKRIEDHKFQAKYNNVTIKPPIFIIGHWRSGTTFMQNILANDDRFAYPNLYQVTNPHTFLISEETFITRLFSILVPKKRLFDNVPFGLKAPHEDEFIAWHSSGLSPSRSWNFPKSTEYFDKYLSFKQCNTNEINRWKNDLINFLKKLTYKYDKTIVLKSPQHTARLNLLLNLFPHARFIHIYRNPYRVYQSTKKLYSFVYKISSFQKYDSDKIHQRILNQYKEMYDCYFEDRKHVSDSQLVEIKFEDLEEKPLEILESVYKNLALPSFEYVEKQIKLYLTSINNHKKNDFSDLEQSIKSEIYNKWQRNFDTWGYIR